MQPFPHTYSVEVSAAPTGACATRAEGKTALDVAAPAEFDGPGDLWSPEELLIAAIADCYALSFRAVATASRLEWENLEVSASGTLDKVERVTRFTEVRIQARLTVANDDLHDKALRLLQKAEDICLITNSMSVEPVLQAEVVLA